MRRENGNAESRTSARFLSDLVIAAQAAGLPPNKAKIAEAFAPFAEYFCSQPVEIRTTTLEPQRREVSFRFVDETAHGEVWSLARSWFELMGPEAAWMSAVHATFGLRAEGIDADVRTGFRKVWAFLSAGHPLERFIALKGAPPALQSVRDVLARYDLAHMSIVGTDHFNSTCNLYPMLAPGWANREVVRELAKALDFEPLADDWLAYVERSVAANFTFSWASGRMERMSFYRPAMSLEELPDDPVLQRFATQCPVLTPHRAFIPSIAYSRQGHYRKLELDYDGNIVGVLVRCAQVPRVAT